MSNYNSSVLNGDLVATSPIGGIGMKQKVDIIRSHIVVVIVMNYAFELDSDKYACNEVTKDGMTFHKVLLASV